DNSTEVEIPYLEAARDALITPKIDMHIITSVLEETHVEWIAKTYGILLDLHPRLILARMTMDELPDDAI
nr:hypothetical protein [Tanacetum cinerariifolium]